MTDSPDYVMALSPLGDACPCEIAEEPCMTNCSCAYPLMSAGCLCCCRHGSDDQRRAMAELIIKTMQEAQYRAASLSKDSA